MPTYSYECKKCGHHFEKFQKMTDDPARKCPKCKGAVRRMLSPGAGFIFKGNGFYHTDYKKPGAEKEKKNGNKQDDQKPCEKADNCPCCET
ncbi:MAG: FmdB family zinc ribbon protein [Candidatus Omnitrophota bacterium]|nr:FmdB family zinc ribbon protein [Candidatus Omnitrophota bacterium]